MAPGLLLRKARLDAGLTQAQLAARLGLTQPAVAKLERRDANPTVATLDRALHATGHELSLERAANDVDESQIAERLRLTPAARLAAFQASHRNLRDLVKQASRGRRATSAPWPGPSRGPHAELDVARILRTLTERGVDFVVIGGIAAVLHGSARNTFDLDICIATDPANVEALGDALIALHARLRGVDAAPFVPDAATLRRIEVLTLSTDAGDLDVLARPAGAARFDALRRHADRFDLGGFSVLVASVEDLIAMKSAAGRPKDREAVAELETIRRLRGRV
jgi:transcriptional regulator with XRE-family HTH domain